MKKELYGRYLILMLFRKDLRFGSLLALRRGELKPQDIDILRDVRHHWTSYAQAARIDFVDLDGTTTTLRVRREKREEYPVSLVTVEDIRPQFKQGAAA